MIRLASIPALAVAVAACTGEKGVELKSDNGRLVLTYACAESGAQIIDPNTIKAVRDVVARDNAEHILASTNPLRDLPEALAVRSAMESRDFEALELAVASYVCDRGHPPTRPPRFPEPGSTPPDVLLTPMTLDGRESPTLRLADLRGRAVVIVFWSTWCPACREEYVELQKLTLRGTHDAVSTYAILHADVEENLLNWQVEHGDGVTFVVDEGDEIARQYRVYGIPHTVVIRPDGNLHISGHVHPNDLEAVVNEALTFHDKIPA